MRRMFNRTTKHLDADVRDLDHLYMTARTVISVLYYEDAAPQQRKETLDECSLKFQQHLDAGATVGLVDVCGIVVFLQNIYANFCQFCTLA